jgi:hypothetical protein
LMFNIRIYSYYFDFLVGIKFLLRLRYIWIIRIRRYLGYLKNTFWNRTPCHAFRFRLEDNSDWNRIRSMSDNYNRMSPSIFHIVPLSRIALVHTYKMHIYLVGLTTGSGYNNMSLCLIKNTLVI